MGSQAAERSLTELKEFASQLKALPNIQRHIGLAEAVNRVINAPAFRARVGSEQSILDGQSADAAAEAIEVGQSLLTWIRFFSLLIQQTQQNPCAFLAFLCCVMVAGSSRWSHATG